MKKIYFEEQVKKRVSILNRSGFLTPKTRLKDGVLNVDEIRYYVNDYVLYINIPKLLLKITNADKTTINKKKINDFVESIFGTKKIIKIEGVFAYIPLKGNYNVVLKNIQKIIKEKNASNNNTEQINQNTQSPEETKPQTNNTNQQQEVQSPPTTETKENIAQIILNNFKTKITDQKMMTSVNSIDFNKKDDNDLNSLYVKYLTYLYLKDNQQLEIVKNTIKNKKRGNSQGRPPKAFISKYGNLIFNDLKNKEIIDDIKKNINTYFENEEDYDFFGELKHADLFLERYLRG